MKYHEGGQQTINKCVYTIFILTPKYLIEYFIYG